MGAITVFGAGGVAGAITAFARDTTATLVTQLRAAALGEPDVAVAGQTAVFRVVHALQHGALFLVT